MGGAVADQPGDCAGSAGGDGGVDGDLVVVLVVERFDAECLAEELADTWRCVVQQARVDGQLIPTPARPLSGQVLAKVLAVPPGLGNVLAALAVEPGRDEYQAAEERLGLSLDGLAGVRREPAAETDGADLTPSQVREWLAGLPVRPDEDASVVWVADRIGARMPFAAFVANFDDLWFPAMDDVVVLLDSGGALCVLVLDHEEKFTFSRVSA